MAYSKYKGFPRKKLDSELRMVVSSLKKENAYLKKTLVELCHQHSKHNKLVERFLSLEADWLETAQQLKAKDEKISLLSEQLSMMRASSMSDLQNQLKDALEKNKQWLEYDQQREAYVRDILARMLCLEKQLNEANRARSQQHNEDHSDEKDLISQMQEHYERLLQKIRDELEVLREEVDKTNQNLTMTQEWCMDRQNVVEELEQQLQTEKMKREGAAEDLDSSEEEEPEEETIDHQERLDEEKRRSANFELQVKISSLEDEQNFSYLKNQMIRILKKLKKTKKDHVTKQSKGDRQDRDSCEVAHPPSRDSPTYSPRSSLMNESFLECPSCSAKYPASQYRELMNHLEFCLD